MQKTYLAVTLAKPQILADTLRHFLVKDRSVNISRAFARLPKGNPEAQEAILEYEWLGEVGRFNLLRIKPLTGRPHQIRVQLSSIGCPIAGDMKYGAQTPLADGSIGLHAQKLAFEHPVRLEQLEVVAPLPELEFWNPFR